jgi:hypothetical protein
MHPKLVNAFLVACANLLTVTFAGGQQPPTAPTADAIMARVATNQDASEAARAHYVYVQHAHVTSHKGKTVMCEEITDSRVTPTDSGSQQQLLKLDGKLLRKHRYVLYNTLPVNNDKGQAAKDSEDVHVTVNEGNEMDRDLVENMRNGLTNNKSKDGIGAGLFPLTSKTQQDYRFELVGHEPKNGRDCFHIVFGPKEKDDYGWKGDAWIDAITYQPVVVRTVMARNIPFAVRTLLGTSVPGLGFTVIYAPQRDGVWFPVSFGTEFKLRVLFFLNRQITLSA